MTNTSPNQDAELRERLLGDVRFVLPKANTYITDDAFADNLANSITSLFDIYSKTLLTHRVQTAVEEFAVDVVADLSKLQTYRLSESHTDILVERKDVESVVTERVQIARQLLQERQTQASGEVEHE